MVFLHKRIGSGCLQSVIAKRVCFSVQLADIFGFRGELGRGIGVMIMIAVAV